MNLTLPPTPNSKGNKKRKEKEARHFRKEKKKKNEGKNLVRYLAVYVVNRKSDSHSFIICFVPYSNASPCRCFPSGGLPS